VGHDDLVKAADAIAQLGTGADLTARISAIEAALTGKQRRAVERTIAKSGVDEGLLNGAITIKNLAGQINVVIHAVGILMALPHLLARDERIESVSLGAGNTGRAHDLVPIGGSLSSSSSTGGADRNQSARTGSSSTCSTLPLPRPTSVDICTYSVVNTPSVSCQADEHCRAS